ncbi:MAG: Rrf2 family transcriptional regulator [Erysipelotrichia bacterium]|nr:Rrf2 family transcriptional regulator [Erysipelotrichia bacterium]
MITREADYAIRTVLHLARHFGQKPVTTTEISKKTDVPYRFLRKISHQLVEAGIVGAVRGKQGGIFLITSPEILSLLDILKIFDSRAISVNICCCETGNCSHAPDCTVQKRLLKLQQNMQAEFASIKFSEL